MSCSLAFRPISRQVFATLLFAAVLAFSCAVLTLGGVSQIFTALLRRSSRSAARSSRSMARASISRAVVIR
jgi:hypothetical protein